MSSIQGVYTSFAALSCEVDPVLKFCIFYRLVEETYTSEEVQQILDGLCTVVRAEVESELINSTHTNVVLLRQLCKQAEQWHLQLQADMSELEDG